MKESRLLKLSTLIELGAYDEAYATARKAYDEACATARKAHDEACAPALKAYNEARTTAWKAYDEVCAPARKAYNEVCASAFAREFDKARTPTQGKARFGKARAPDCTCDHRFTCGACLRAAQ
jgi:hypothetical protein